MGNGINWANFRGDIDEATELVEILDDQDRLELDTIRNVDQKSRKAFKRSIRKENDR